MSHILQVGAGSGGIAVLDLLARDPRVTRITLIEPDSYKPHNVYRHLFPANAVGRLKAELATEWVHAIRPEIGCEPHIANITDTSRHEEFSALACECDLGICAVDNEAAKFAFDSLMRSANKPWTLGEVLSGGIGGWVHRFLPNAACYGCVASYLQREVTEKPIAPPPDYNNPTATIRETTIPANKPSIAVIAAMHSLVSLELLQPRAEESAPPDEFTSLLFSLQTVPGVFDSPFRAHKLRIARSPTCLICGTNTPPIAGESLDAALDQALAQLGAR